jgi:hypothetical protein
MTNGADIAGASPAASARFRKLQYVMLCWSGIFVLPFRMRYLLRMRLLLGAQVSCYQRDRGIGR